MDEDNALRTLDSLIRACLDAEEKMDDMMADIDKIRRELENHRVFFEMMEYEIQKNKIKNADTKKIEEKDFEM